jgi:nitrite reductase (NADH) small subunit
MSRVFDDQSKAIGIGGAHRRVRLATRPPRLDAMVGHRVIVDGMAPGDDGIDNRAHDFVTVARVSELPSKRGRQVTVDGCWVALFNVDGAYYALDALCLHQGGPLAEGTLGQCIVTCPWHGWQYDVRTGVLVQDPRVGVTLHETRVVGDEIQVRLKPFLDNVGTR